MELNSKAVVSFGQPSWVVCCGVWGFESPLFAFSQHESRSYKVIKSAFYGWMSNDKCWTETCFLDVRYIFSGWQVVTSRGRSKVFEDRRFQATFHRLCRRFAMPIIFPFDKLRLDPKWLGWVAWTPKHSGINTAIKDLNMDQVRYWWKLLR